MDVETGAAPRPEARLEMAGTPAITERAKGNPWHSRNPDEVSWRCSVPRQTGFRFKKPRGDWP